jgi:hypothetical protein
MMMAPFFRGMPSGSLDARSVPEQHMMMTSVVRGRQVVESKRFVDETVIYPPVCYDAGNLITY